MGAAAALFAVGLLDDLRGIGAKTKLLAQILGGSILYLSGLRFTLLQPTNPPSWVNSAVCFAATVAWVVLICNAINLIDGIDGLAAGAALFSMGTILTVGLVEGNLGVALGAAILAGCVLGFLVFNFNPASIFLGDSGSLFVGFMLSGLVLAESHHRLTAVRAVCIPLIALALPLADTALSILRRFLSGHSLFGADREHIHHKLLALGLTQREVVAVLYTFSAIFAVLSLFLFYRSALILVMVPVIVLLVLFFGIRRLKYQEFSEFARVWKRMRQQKEVFARNIAVRKAVLELRKLPDVGRLKTLLEEMLQADFDGYELSLDPEVIAAENAVACWDGPMVCVWKNGYAEKAVLTLELSSPIHGLIGRISLYRPVGSGWLVDTDLLSGDFREALGIAVANCILNPSGAPLLVGQPHVNASAADDRDAGWVSEPVAELQSVENPAAE